MARVESEEEAAEAARELEEQRALSAVRVARAAGAQRTANTQSTLPSRLATDHARSTVWGLSSGITSCVPGLIHSSTIQLPTFQPGASLSNVVAAGGDLQSLRVLAQQGKLQDVSEELSRLGFTKIDARMAIREQLGQLQPVAASARSVQSYETNV